MMKIALLIIAAAALFVLFCYVLFRMVCVRGRVSDRTVGSLTSDSPLAPYKDEIKKGFEYFDSLKKETLTITSFDGLKLAADYIKNGSEDKILILMHGYRSSARSDFAACIKFYREQGFSILLPDQRAHSRSEGRYISYGIYEKEDCRYWVREMAKRTGGESKIYLGGISMGATTVLLTSALDLPPCVCAVIADCGFSCGYDEVLLTAKRINRHIPKFIITVINFMCRIFAGFDLRDDNTQLSLKKSKLPTLFIHGTRDMFVPCEMTLRNFDACRSEKELLTVPGASHGMSFLVNNGAYTAAVKSFLEKY